MNAQSQALTLSAPMTSVVDVVHERIRQLEQEGCDPRRRPDGELAQAAACYALPQGLMSWLEKRDITLWPWAPERRSSTDRRSDLVKAAALILAEIDRLDRAASLMQEEHHHG